MGKALKRKRQRESQKNIAISSQGENSHSETKETKNAFHVFFTKSAFHIFLIAIVAIAAYSNTFNSPFVFDDAPNITENPVIKDLDNFTSSSKGYDFNPRRFIGYLTFALNYHFGGLDVTGYHIVNLVIHILNSILVYFLVRLTFNTPFFSSHNPPSSPLNLTDHVPHFLLDTGNSAMTRNIFSNSPLEKGDKGGCEDDMEGESKKQPPPPPLLRGNFSPNSRHLPCPAGLVGHDQLNLRGDRGGVQFIPLFSALLFVAHPIQTQAVTYIVQRFTSLATMFYLLSLVMYVTARMQDASRSDSQRRLASRYKIQDITPLNPPLPRGNTPLHPPLVRGELKGGIMHRASWILYFFSLLFAILAMMTKEIAFTLPLIIALYEFTFFKTTLKKKLLILLPILLTLIIIPVSIIGTDKPVGEILSDLSEQTRVQTDISRWDYLLTQMKVITTYIRLIFLPINQNLDYNYPIYHSLFTPSVFLSFMLLLSLFVLGVYLFYRSRITADSSPPADSELLTPNSRLISFGIFWFFITLSVESSIIPITDVIFEHRVYLPSVGAFIAITSSVFFIVEKAKSKWQGIEKAAISGFVIVVIALAGVSYARNIVWQSEITLWEDVISKSPEKARGHYNLGITYWHKGLPDKAIEHYERAIKLKPDYADAYNNLGVAYWNNGLPDKAIEHFQSAIKLKNDNVEALNNIGNAYSKKGLFDTAIEHYEIAIRIKPDFVKTHNNLGMAYKNKGLIDKAIEHFQIALRLEPDYAIAHYNLGLVYKNKGLHDKATEHFNIARRLNPAL